MNDCVTRSESASPRVALTIAGSDSGGGAGIQADLKTFEAFGVFGCSALTALTAQNSLGVHAVHLVPPEFVRHQLHAVLSDLPVAAAKVGMLANGAVVQAVVAALENWPALPVVVDPVMVATSGDRLLDTDAEVMLKQRLLPRTTLLTPNRPEAAALLGETPASDRRALWRQAEGLLALGPTAILLKGGHGTGPDSADLLLTPEHSEVFSFPRLNTRNTHGSGCTLSAAVAAALAQGYSLRDAIAVARDYVQRALSGSARWVLGQGPGSLNHRAHSPLFAVPDILNAGISGKGS
ncbi:bifunctional hydroxymethylpyrimidine kinase/phosphomethylpyrimidine kinase [Marinimicrobium sp. ARAG 43.8]|uniref:bifunctional hydroxymethylpyrimidine kinase/phosphomethylpyrimidine kinase n=1 Tax=Marinimicrobium sp. ARAG 43.8 TaxID=3418719 RepID=UPI003CF00380